MSPRISQYGRFAMPTIDVTVASIRFAKAIQNRHESDGLKVIGYEIFYLSSCLLGLASVLFGQRRLELASYACFAVGTVGELQLELERPEIPLKLISLSIGALQLTQCAYVTFNGRPGRLLQLSLATRAASFGRMWMLWPD